MASSVVAVLGLTGAVAFAGADSQGTRETDTRGGRSHDQRAQLFEVPTSAVPDDARLTNESIELAEDFDGRLEAPAYRFFRTRIDGVPASSSPPEPSLVESIFDLDVSDASELAAPPSPPTPVRSTSSTPVTAAAASVPVVTSTTRPSSGSAPVATTTTTRPVSSAPAPVSVAGAVVVAPGASIQAAVDSHGPGTTFLIKSGVHRGQHVVPKDGDVFVGEPGAVLAGDSSTEYAFSGMGADNVRIQGLVVEGYASPLQTGAIRYVNGHDSHGWVVEGNEVRSNKGIGIQAGPLWQVLGNYVHHNGQMGLSGSGGEILVQGNEVAFNNTDGNNPYWEAGGTKFVFTSQLVLRDNYVHDNKGPGLWCDINNIDVLYENNRVVNNDGPGIFHEVSYDAVIRNNVVEGNGFGFTGWIDGAGILVSSSPNVEVYGNTVRGNNDGIAGKHVSRPDAAVANHGPWELRNLWVHDNVISMNVGQTGIVANTGNGEVYSSWGNRFDRNTYTLGGNAGYYWGENELSTGEWKQAGQDPNGTWK